MKKELTLLQKIVSSILLVGTGLTLILFFVWLIKILIQKIF